MELFRLEKPSETIKSNCVPSTIKVTHVPKCQICTFVKPPRDKYSIIMALGSLCQGWAVLSMKKSSRYPNQTSPGTT